MKLKASIKVMNNVTYSGDVVLESETNNGSIEMRVADKIIELSRGDLVEFLHRTEPYPKNPHLFEKGTEPK